MKKQIITTIFGLFLALSLLAQSPQSFKYQAVLRDNVGDIMDNTNVDIRISIRQSTASGTLVYQETFTECTNQFGLVHLNIGEGTPVSGSFPTISWGTDNYYIQVEVDAGSGYTDMGASPLLSVPYALYANDAGVTGATGPTGPQGSMGHRDRRGTRGLKDHKALRAHKDLLDLPERKGHRERKGLKDCKGLKERKERQGQQDQQDRRDLPTPWHKLWPLETVPALTISI